jgi:hypothetical protein
MIEKGESFKFAGNLIYHFVPTTPKGDVCKAIRSVDYWAFLVEDCSRTLNQSIPIRYKTHESSSWKCDDVIPFNTQEEWISPSILQNEGRLPLVIVEVQVGEYTGEDDIFRVEDDYKRS